MLAIDTTNLHATYLHPMTGEGLIVQPLPSSDLQLDALGASLHAADELSPLARLDALGWELADDWCYVGHTADGRKAFALYGRQPITSTPTLAEQATAMRALMQAASVRAA
jgi:hypothetical protein